MKFGGTRTAAVLGALLVISAMTAAGCSISSSSGSNGSAPGSSGADTAPGFSGITLEGTQVSMDQYRGKPLVLAFMASW